MYVCAHDADDRVAPRAAVHLYRRQDAREAERERERVCLLQPLDPCVWGVGEQTQGLLAHALCGCGRGPVVPGLCWLLLQTPNCQECTFKCKSGATCGVWRGELGGGDVLGCLGWPWATCRSEKESKDRSLQRGSPCPLTWAPHDFVMSRPRDKMSGSHAWAKEAESSQHASPLAYTSAY